MYTAHGDTYWPLAMGNSRGMEEWTADVQRGGHFAVIPNFS